MAFGLATLITLSIGYSFTIAEPGTGWGLGNSPILSARRDIENSQFKWRTDQSSSSSLDLIPIIMAHILCASFLYRRKPHIYYESSFLIG
jgi:hypothetical protein